MRFFLNPEQVKALIKEAESLDEVVIIRCVRKGPASKAGGPDQGELYDLHCTRKPKYIGKNPPTVRKSEDRKHGVLTVYASNRRDKKSGRLGSWRRVNISQVQKVIDWRGHEYEVRES